MVSISENGGKSLLGPEINLEEYLYNNSKDYVVIAVFDLLLK